jgi:hypothetical protein
VQCRHNYILRLGDYVCLASESWLPCRDGACPVCFGHSGRRGKPRLYRSCGGGLRPDLDGAEPRHHTAKNELPL